jgi:ribosomal protein S12 methylthiotransferase accessory factor
MLRRPTFKSHLRVEIVEPDLLFLLFETESHAIRSRLHVLLAPLLDGRNGFAAIARQLAKYASPMDIRYGLESLERRGYLAEANGRTADPDRSFYEALDLPSNGLQKQLKSRGVRVAAFGEVYKDRFAKILKSLGIAVGTKEGVPVVLTDDYLRDELQEVNRAALKSKRPWMLVKPVGTELWIGPILRPGQTGCWECLAKRLREQRQGEVLLRKLKNGSGTAGRTFVTLASTVETALNLAATEIWRWLVEGKNEALSGKLICLSLRTLAWESHRLLRQPHCRECGKERAAVNGESLRLVLHETKKRFAADGGYRAEAPEETYRKYKHHISSITGIVQRIAPRATKNADLIRVYVAEHSFPQARTSARLLAQGFRSHSAGKGMTPAQARTSALCEALERYSGVFQGDEPRQMACLRELGSRAIDPRTCLNFSDQQYRDREKWNARESRYNWIPVPFDERREIEWTPAWSLTYDRVKYVPTSYCYYGYPADADHDFCRADSNGNAAGNTLEEAILQGFLEVVERDAVALWWYNKVRRPAVDPGTFREVYFDKLLEYYESNGRSLHVLDITSDFGIPTFAAASFLKKGSGAGLVLGFGCHLDARLAVGRALTEMNQFLPEVRLGKKRLVFENNLGNAKFLAPKASLGTLSARDYPKLGGEDLKGYVKLCVNLARKRGMETMVLDQTRADVGLHVVKVIVPGMRQFWARFGPGRLYQVPVQLGWFAKPRREADLNRAYLCI